MELETLWQEYQSNIKAFLFSKVANPADVDDLLQDILIKTHQNLDTLNSKQSVKPWLFQIANNTIIDFYRKNGRLNEISDEGILNRTQDDNDESPPNDLARCITPLLQKLPKENAALLKAIDIEGHAQKDYAAQVGISYSTLKSRVQKSRQMLRALYDQCCHLSFDSYGKVIDYIPKSENC